MIVYMDTITQHYIQHVFIEVLLELRHHKDNNIDSAVKIVFERQGMERALGIKLVQNKPKR